MSNFLKYHLDNKDWTETVCIKQQNFEGDKTVDVLQISSPPKRKRKERDNKREIKRVIESETKNGKETTREISLGVWIALLLLLLLDEHHRVIEQTLKETVEPQMRFFLD